MPKHRGDAFSIPAATATIAANHTIEEIREIIGVDSIGFLSVEACDKIAAGAKCKFCKGCFTGEYPIDPPVRKHINKYDQPLTLEMKNKVKK